MWRRITLLIKLLNHQRKSQVAEPSPVLGILIKQAIEASDCLRPELDLRTEDIVEIELCLRMGVRFPYIRVL
ncbi:hypothetical protein HanHA89_Chr05g0197561 [Helianthus annuus]|nr:hypothetical protein HanHA89_Chr05g0197561 [Helianthus annuus]